jgi:glycerol-3-phosphate acyltransferase PlsY
VLGHNYSLFLLERNERGKLRMRGGAGGAPAVGGAFGLWWPSILIILPIGALILFVVGYASLATMSVALISILIFGYLGANGLAPWQYILYGVLTLFLQVIALRPNIVRLMNGTERLVGLRAKKKEKG